FEGVKNGTDRQIKETKTRLAQYRQRIEALQAETEQFLRACRQSASVSTTAPAAEQPDDADALDLLDQCLARAEAQLAGLKRLRAPKYFRSLRLLLILFGLDKKVIRLYQPLAQELARAADLLSQGRQQAMLNARRLLALGRKRHNRDLGQAKAKYQRLRAETKQRRLQSWKQLSQKYRQRRLEIKERHDVDLTQVTEKWEGLRAEIQERYEHDSRQAQERHAAQLASSRALHEAERTRLVNDWQGRLHRVCSAVAEINRDCDERFRSWDDPSWSNWTPTNSLPSAIPFGEYHVEKVSGPFSDAPEKGPDTFCLPALISFPNRFAMQIMADDAGR